MRYARLIDANVTEITNRDPVGRYHPDLIWQEIDPAQPTAPYVVAGWQYVDGAFQPADLEAFKTEGAARVNAAAEAARARFLTQGQGQAMTYEAKAAEARAYLAALLGGTPVDEDYPFLKAEAEATGQAIGDLAGEVSQTSDAWTATGATIEGLRKGALLAITNAATADDVIAAEAVTWPTPS
jgi:hypothetical protein